MSAHAGGGLDPRFLELVRKRVEASHKKEDLDRELRFLDIVTKQRASVDPEGMLGRWLMASLPVSVYGPPESQSTRAREDARLAKKRGRWTLGLRTFLWGGGGLVIFIVALFLFTQQRRLATQIGDVLGDETAALEVTERRSLLLRGAGVIAFLVFVLVLLARMLESLVWNLPA